MMNNQIATLHAAFKRVRHAMNAWSRSTTAPTEEPEEPGAFDHRLGICGNAVRMVGAGNIDAKLMVELMATWPRASGTPHFPVPSMDTDWSPAGKFYNAVSTEMWGGHQPYGRARRALLDWLIAVTAPDYPTTKHNLNDALRTVRGAVNVPDPTVWFDPSLGICDNVEYATWAVVDDDESADTASQAMLLLDALMRSWPQACGHPDYPIPGGAVAFNRASEDGTMWDESTDYGRARHELLNWLIERTN